MYVRKESKERKEGNQNRRHRKIKSKVEHMFAWVPWYRSRRPAV
jgi:hypothetical protein